MNLDQHHNQLRDLLHRKLDERHTERTHNTHPAKGEPTMSRQDAYTHTDRQAIDDGDLIDLPGIGVKVDFNGRPITRMTSALSAALARLNPGRTERERAAFCHSQVGILAADARDVAEPGEESGVVFHAPTIEGAAVYLCSNDDGWTIMLGTDW